MKWLALALLPLAATAQEITAENPRVHGWWLGDRMQQRIRITLPPGAALDPASLPRARAVDYWLDLLTVERRDVPGGVALTLTWQNFYAALEPSLRQVPASPIRLLDGTRLALPGFAYVTAPIRPIMAPSRPDQMQPDPPYHLIDPAPARAGLAVSAAGLLLGLLALARHQGWFPFHARAARPFTRAARRIRALPAPQARQALHRAFDAAFGRVLIGADLDHFLDRAPHYAPLRDRLALFFAGSDAAFFGLGEPAAQDLPALARDLAAIERGRR